MQYLAVLKFCLNGVHLIPRKSGGIVTLLHHMSKLDQSSLWI